MIITEVGEACLARFCFVSEAFGPMQLSFDTQTFIFFVQLIQSGAERLTAAEKHSPTTQLEPYLTTPRQTTTSPWPTLRTCVV